MKLITFSLWGEDLKYCAGALRNAELAAIHYPDWKCRFYIGEADPHQDKNGGTHGRVVRQLSRMKNVEIKALDQPACWHGMFWRFYPASEDDVDVFISRDCDSRLGAREASAVNEWMNSPYLVHSMADHPYHFHPKMGLMGGMFGMKRHAFPQMKVMINSFQQDYPARWQCDQDFLRDRVYPTVSHKIMAHSDLHNGCNPFPIARTGNDFVGAIIGSMEERLHPEHHALIRSNECG